LFVQLLYSGGYYDVFSCHGKLLSNLVPNIDGNYLPAMETDANTCFGTIGSGSKMIYGLGNFDSRAEQILNMIWEKSFKTMLLKLQSIQLD